MTTSARVKIVNARIWTPIGVQSWLTFDQATGTILSIGSGSSSSSSSSESDDGATTATTAAEPDNAVRVIDLGGRIVLPGLQDAHIHLMHIGHEMAKLQLRGTNSIASLQEKLRQYHATKAASMNEADRATQWLVGVGWDQDTLGLPSGVYPSRHDLDAAVPANVPVVLFRACYHICVASTEALRLAGLLGSNPVTVPAGGTADRDESGEFTGILRENAVVLIYPFVQDNIPRILQKRYLEAGLQSCLRNGLTAVQTNDACAWDLYQELQSEGKMPIRVFLTLMHDELVSPPTQFQSVVPAPKQQEGLLSCDRVKLFSDGSLGAETAALRAPYANSSSKGLLILTDAEMNAKVQLAHDRGFRLEIHAIGDAGAEQAIRAFELAGATGPVHRPILTHCQILGSDLIDRMSQLGVVADVQPPFVGTDCAWVAKRLGDGSDGSAAPGVAEHLQDRLRSSYAWKTLLTRGIHVAGGSDAPIETCSPFVGLHSAIFRQPHGAPRETPAWMPSECLTFAEAMHLYTDGAAYAACRETTLGTLAAGFAADFVVLEYNDVTDPVGRGLATPWADPHQLLNVHAAQVWVNGQLRLDVAQAASAHPPVGGAAEWTAGVASCVCHRAF
ncbi:metal-dependent hydrolase [Capsaspora owczarzaki ATCC 30864]|uniref:Metal-dependent hydrolase n=1 Tax=Capsaspora owczarzaki (strain ATCC 30864) TaxID=595528 RepID=A0A0D2UAI6_CAPO3|nr:metal-dependent hydrolase [Capsaspora owczarzaki ATCC 30864]KJE92046.1 metal-dependent hydrolase [Capsaspora owczarzaki ATCC 30864]|eukprot:XP_004363916.2 metal-dependent hydrolase [Capsaspora owczarzaki ATCC 30864]